MSKKNFAISILGLVGLMGTAWGSACTSSSNPCTAGSATGSDTTDRTTFENDTLNTTADLAFTTINFNSIVMATNYSTAGLTTDGVTFTGTASNGADLWGGPIVSWSDGGALYVLDPDGTITVTLPSDVYAFDTDLIIASGNNESLQYSVSYNNGAVVHDSSAASEGLPGSVFFGVTSATPITSVTISPGFSSDLLAIDNFDIGQAAPTPEMGTLVLIGTGLILLRFIQRRRRRFLM